MWIVCIYVNNCKYFIKQKPGVLRDPKEGKKEIRKDQENFKSSQNYNLTPSLSLPKRKYFFLCQQITAEKQKLKPSRIALSHKKIRACHENHIDKVIKSNSNKLHFSTFLLWGPLLKLNDEILVCVAATVDDLPLLKLQISDSLSNYLTTVVQYLKEVSNNQQNFLIKTLNAGIALKTLPVTLLMRMISLMSGQRRANIIPRKRSKSLNENFKCKNDICFL